jgi:UDP-glucose 4-epimerase
MSGYMTRAPDRSMDAAMGLALPQRFADDRLKDLRCLVLGGGGFIGQNLVLRLQDAGAELSVYGRSGQTAELSNVAWHRGLLTDDKAVAEALKGKNVVFHLIGNSTPSSSLSDPAAELSDFVIPTLRLLEQCVRQKIPKVIFASSGGTIYGPTAKTPIVETAPLNPATPYGIGKVAVEHYMRMYRENTELQAISLRIANPFGPLQSPYRKQGVVSTFIHKALMREKIEVWGDGSIVRDFVYIDDLVDAFLRAALYEGPFGAFNIGGGEGQSVRGILDTISRMLNLTPNVEYRPSRKLDVPNNVLDVTLVEKEMEWRAQTPLAVGLERTADWLRRHVIRPS